MTNGWRLSRWFTSSRSKRNKLVFLYSLFGALIVAVWLFVLTSREPNDMLWAVSVFGSFGLAYTFMLHVWMVQEEHSKDFSAIPGLIAGLTAFLLWVAIFTVLARPSWL